MLLQALTPSDHPPQLHFQASSGGARNFGFQLNWNNVKLAEMEKVAYLIEQDMFLQYNLHSSSTSPSSLFILLK